MKRTMILSVAVLIAAVMFISNSMTRVQAQVPPITAADAEIAVLKLICGTSYMQLHAETTSIFTATGILADASEKSCNELGDVEEIA